MQKSPADLFGLPNCGQKSRREVDEKLTLGMTLDEESYRAAVVVTVATISKQGGNERDGALRLPGRVVWTRLRETEHILEGDRRSLHESGVEFTRLTAEQQAALALTLATFRAAQTRLGDAAVPTDTPPQGAQGSST